MGWTQIVLGGLNRTSVIEQRSVESREQFGSTIVPHIHQRPPEFPQLCNAENVCR